MSQPRIASAMVYVQEELSDARMRCDEVRAMVARCLELVNKSNQKDHLYAVAGDVIHGLPQALLALQRAIEAAAMAVNKVDYEDLRQTLRPEKVEELERVLESVRLRLPRRTGSAAPPIQKADSVDELYDQLHDALHGVVDTHDVGVWSSQIDRAIEGFRSRKAKR